MPGFILLSQPVHEAISDDEMRKALEHANANAIPVKIEPARFALADTIHANWGDLQRKQEVLVEQKLRPIVAEHFDYEIAFFGLAPIPLAIHLGYLVDRWRRSHVFQRHHTEHVWTWKPDGPPPIDVTTDGLPQDIVRSEGDVVLRVSVTARVDPKETAKVVRLPSAEIDIAVPEPKEDVLQARADLEAVATKVKEALDRLKTHRPNARRVHLFAAVPVGLAFRLGTLVSATQHNRVQTYQYFHRADPRHHRAILLGDDAPRVRELTDEDRAKAVTTRQAWADDLSRTKGFADNIASRAKRSAKDAWFALLDVPPAPWGEAWRKLAPLHGTPMARSSVDANARVVEGGFRYEEARDAWLVSDDLLSAIGRRIEAPAALTRAGRMLFFHEAIHIQSHHLTEATAPSIRRFPKILEEVDYQADVWAMIHECAFTKHYHHAEAVDERALFLEIVKTAVETMWAFDDGLDELERMEIRRVNRYLIWYWQLLHLERCSSLDEIASVLAKKPLIELAGPRVHTDDDRVFYELREPWSADLEFAAQLGHARVVRHGRSAAIDIPALIAGFRQRNGDRIKAVLKGIVDQEVAR
jgi:hypothetical protein